MAYTFTTESGSAYLVMDGRLTRAYGCGFIADAGDGCDMPALRTALEGGVRIVSVQVAPVVGRRARFRIALPDGGSDVLATSRVEAVHGR